MRTQTAVSEPPLATGGQEPTPPGKPEGKEVLAGRRPRFSFPKEPRSARVSRAWNGVVPALVLLAFILVFIFQNLHKARVSFLTLSGTVQLAVGLLAAAGFGCLLVLVLGSVRMLLLRKVMRRSRRNGAHATPDGTK
jgi:uncharacterized integral membrane protein